METPAGVSLQNMDKSTPTMFPPILLYSSHGGNFRESTLGSLSCHSAKVGQVPLINNLRKLPSQETLFPKQWGGST